MAATSPAENVLGLSNKDLSLIRHSLEAGGKLIHQVINGLKHGTSEVQHLILQQSDVILECRVCRNLFRSLPNYLDHKRIYCQELFPNAGVSLLASPFADEVPIIYPEPPDDAKEFVEMSDLISKFNRKNHLEPSAAAATPRKDKAAYVQNIRESIGRTLEQSCQRRKPQPLYLRPIKETNVAMQLVPLTTNNASENRNQVVLAGGEGTDLNERQNKSCTVEHRNFGHTLIKLANFPKLLCLKCNQTYSSKKRLIYHIKKFHKKKYRNCKEKCNTNCQVVNQSSNKSVSDAKAGSRKESKQKELENKNDLEGFSTKSGKPSLKKFSYLAKMSNAVKYSDIKNGWCHICNHSYSGKRGLIFHMFRMHSGCRKIYPCLFCEVKFPSFASALRHTQNLHNCKKSDMKHVVKKLKASGHVENQQLQSMLEPEIKVEKCDTQMNVLVQGNKVMSSLDPNGSLLDPAEDDTNSKTSQQKSKFKCPNCLQIFSGIRGLRHHITRKHSDTQKTTENPYACHICFMAFFTNFSLKRHYRLKHNIQENIQENTSNAERKVEAVHSQVKTDHIPCQGTSVSMLGKNFLLHNNKKYQIPLKYYKTVSKLAHFPSLCLNCKQRFAGARDLIRHIIRVHCTYKNAFPCPFCHLSFISSVSILRHTKVQHSCSDQEIADLSRKLQVWEHQKKRSLDVKIRKPVNNISDSTNEVQNTADFIPSPKTFSIHDITDFQTSMCLHCNRKFSGLQGLVTHIGKIHSNLSNQKHECFQCTESFGSVFAIIKHMENFHNLFFKQKQTNQKFNQQKTNSLLEIGESAEPSSLSEGQHEGCTEEREKKLDSCKLEKTHGEDAPNSQLVMQCADFLKSRCLRCNEIFAGNRGLIAHIYKAHAHHGQTYSCYICLKTFASFALASQHTRNSHMYKGSAMMYVRVNNISGEVSAEN